jgi:hypothetical protein
MAALGLGSPQELAQADEILPDLQGQNPQELAERLTRH